MGLPLHQERRKALKSGGAKSLNRIDLYGKNLIPMEKLYNLWGPWPPWPPRFLPLCTAHMCCDKADVGSDIKNVAKLIVITHHKNCVSFSCVQMSKYIKHFEPSRKWAPHLQCSCMEINERLFVMNLKLGGQACTYYSILEISAFLLCSVNKRYFRYWIKVHRDL